MLNISILCFLRAVKIVFCVYLPCVEFFEVYIRDVLNIKRAGSFFTSASPMQEFYDSR